MQEFGARYDRDLHERWDWTIRSRAAVSSPLCLESVQTELVRAGDRLAA
jgi:hypothetical protein